MTSTSERKKSTRLSREARQAEILDKARESFESKGFEKTTVADIATELGLVEGTIFHYFGSKRGLMLRVIETFYQRITADLDAGLAAIQGTRNRLYYIIRFHLQTISGSADLCAVILRESRGLEPEFSAEIQRLNRLYTGHLIAVVKAGIGSGEIRTSTSPTLVRNTVYGNIEHVLWDRISDGKPVDVDRVSEELTELVFRGISAEEARLEQGEVALLIKKLNQLLD